MQPTYRLQRDPGTHGVPIFSPSCGQDPADAGTRKIIDALSLNALGEVLVRSG